MHRSEFQRFRHVFLYRPHPVLARPKALERLTGAIGPVACQESGVRRDRIHEGLVCRSRHTCDHGAQGEPTFQVLRANLRIRYP